MADPLSVTASVVAIITAAVQSVKALHSTVSRYKGRDKTLQRLQNELHDISNILDSLSQVVDMEKSVSALLQGPVDRCSKMCREFEQSMNSFIQKSKPGFRDWAKMEFMRGDINEFIDTISGYKSTISVGLGTITIRAVKVSQETLLEYNEMIQDTVYSLNIHLQRVDEKLESTTAPNIPTSNVDLDDEKEITKQCLQICENARHFLESLKQDPIILQTIENAAGKDQNCFKAQLLTRQTLDENQDSFVNIINELRSRLEVLLLNNNPNDGKERSHLLDDINVSKECLEVCRVATEVSSRKIYRIGEVIADGDSDQVVVTTLADLFDVKKAVSKGNSTQLIGSMSDNSLQQMTEKRYNSYSSRFGSHSQAPDHAKTTTGSLATTETRNDSVVPPAKTSNSNESRPRMDHAKPSSNEIRKRMTQDEE